MQNELNDCLKVLQSGGVILFPTDTIWGLGCDATDQKAVSKVFDLKKRDKQKPLVILLFDENRLFDYVKEVPDVAFDLIDLSDDPLTIIYSNAKNLADDVIAEDGSVAIRICKSDACSDLLKKFRKPIVATSANISDKKAPSDFNDISTELVDNVDFIYNSDYRNRNSKASQIIKINNDSTFKIIRS